MSTNLEADFNKAETFWQLEKLYLDLAKVKGKGLTPLEKKILQGLLCGYSPSEIAEKIYHNRNSTSVRVYLSNSLYKYLQELLIRQNQLETKISHWSSITNLLEQAGYKKVPSETDNNLDREDNAANLAIENQPFFYRDWEEKIQIDNFIGREIELVTLRDWIVKEGCRTIVIGGMSGIGKSSLAVKLVEAVQNNFHYVFWRSLRQSLPLERLLNDLIDRFQANIELPETTEDKISLLLDFFHSHRCLLVLDCFDGLFADGKIAGTYREQSKNYGQLLQRLCDRDRGSCCLILSRQQPKELALFSSEKIRSFYLSGLSTTESIQISNRQGLIGSKSEKERFVNFYANNSLIIEQASLTIIKIFNSNLTEFLGNSTFLLSNILEVLDEQFRCLTENERKILYALAVNQKLFQEGKFGKEFSYNLPKHLQIEAIESLQRRSILLPNTRQLAYEPLLRIYIMEKLLQEVEAIIVDRDLSSIVRHLLCE